VGDCRQKGWQTWNFPVEVGARGFHAASCWRMMAALGLQGRTRKKAVTTLAQAAERASSWLWRCRDESSWKLDRRGRRLKPDHLLLSHHTEDVPG